MLRRLILALVATLSVGTGEAAAQFRRDADVPGEFDFYVLALSWSPGFCNAAEGRRDQRQCDPGRRLGFVVHGLWPQYERGFPSRCGQQDRFIPREALAEADGVFPDERLARYEWREHGTCSGLGPREFFRATRGARDKVRVPEALSALELDGETTPGAIERAFSEANPGLRADMMSVQCRRGALQEVRICLSRDLRDFRSCPQVDRATCRVGAIRVTAPN